MGLVISRANAMHFVEVNNNLPNVENTLSQSELYAAFLTKKYCQRWQSNDEIEVQVTSDSVTTPTIEVYGPELLGTISPTLKSSYTDRYFWEFTVDLSSYTDKTIQVKVTQGSTVWISEYQTGEDLTDEINNGYLLKVEYTNTDQPSAFPNYQIDYTTGIDFFIYIEAQIKDPNYQGEDEVFTNVDEKKLIAAQLFKARTLKTDLLPEFMLDKITLASKHFVFMINDLRYVGEGLPDITAGGSNFSALELTITHNEILGFSTDDKGITDSDMTDLILIKKSDSIAGSWTFTVPAGYMIHHAACGHGSGSAGAYTVAFGTTPAGSELQPALTSVALGTIENFNFHEQEEWDTGSDVIIYVTLTGAGAVGKIYVNLIKNFE